MIVVLKIMDAYIFKYILSFDLSKYWLIALYSQNQQRSN